MEALTQMDTSQSDKFSTSPQNISQKSLSDENICAFNEAYEIIESRWQSGDTLHRRKRSSIDRAMRAIAEDFSTGRLDLVVFVLEEVLLNTTYAFKDCPGDITFGFSSESLAHDLNRSQRSIQEVFQDLERCGFLARGRGGAFDGLTGVRLTSKALRDSNVFWVLKMKADLPVKGASVHIRMNSEVETAHLLPGKNAAIQLVAPRITRVYTRRM